MGCLMQRWLGYSPSRRLSWRGKEYDRALQCCFVVATAALKLQMCVPFGFREMCVDIIRNAREGVLLVLGTSKSSLEVSNSWSRAINGCSCPFLHPLLSGCPACQRAKSFLSRFSELGTFLRWRRKHAAISSAVPWVSSVLQ